MLQGASPPGDVTRGPHSLFTGGALKWQESALSAVLPSLALPYLLGLLAPGISPCAYFPPSLVLFLSGGDLALVSGVGPLSWTDSLVPVWPYGFFLFSHPSVGHSLDIYNFFFFFAGVQSSCKWQYNRVGYFYFYWRGFFFFAFGLLPLLAFFGIVLLVTHELLLL